MPLVLATELQMRFIHALCWNKRVFWTNDDGEWEGGKVARFIDALDGDGDGAGCGGGPMGNGVFVTKHEVLLMRRVIGDG